MSDPILAGIQDLPDLYLAKGASFKMTVDMDAGYSMSGKFVTFSIRSQAGINGSKRRIFRTDSDESTISISSQVTTIEIVPETESVPAVAAGWTLADVQAAGATQYWLDFAVDEGDAPDIRLQGRAFWIGEGDELPSGVSIVSAPNLEVSIADDEISVSVAVSGGGIETLDTNTPTSGLTGILKAASNTLDVAVAGTDYLTPTGDGSGLTGIVTTPADGSITNAKLANMAEATFKGRAASAGTGVPVDLTASQARAILNVADGATAFDPSSPGPIGDGTPDAGYFTTLQSDDSVSISDMTDTWNDSGTTFTALKMNVTDTSSAADSKLLDLQEGGVSKFNVEKDGDINVKGKIFLRGTDRYIWWTGSEIAANYGFQIESANLTLSSGSVLFGNYGSGSANQPFAFALSNPADDVLQVGWDHATTPTTQVIRGHSVTTGTGGGITIKGGTGSVANGDVKLDGGNRAAYDASPSATTIRDILISHGLMAAS